jgi:hypothetical protein
VVVAGYIRPGDVVSRRKWFVMHKGIALGDGRVLHNTPFRGEHVTTEREFRAGRRLYVANLEREERLRALRDAHNSDRRSYHLLKNNCEHTVSRATTGRAESPQLHSWVLGAGFAAAAFAVTRHPAVAAAAYAAGRTLSSRLKKRR